MGYNGLLSALEGWADVVHGHLRTYHQKKLPLAAWGFF